MITFNHFHEDIFVHIFSYLEPEKIALLSTVNKLWHKHLTCNALWLKFCITRELKSTNYFDDYCKERSEARLFVNHAKQGNLKVVKMLIDCDKRTVKDLQVTPTNIYSSSYDGYIHVWKLKECLQSSLFLLSLQDFASFFEGLNGMVCFALMDDYFAIARGNTIYLKNRLTANLDYTLKGHKKLVTCLEVLSDKTLVSGSDDSRICIWDAEGKAKFVLEGHRDAVTCIQSIDGFIISGSFDRSIRIWNQKTGALLYNLFGHQGTITCLKATKKYIVSGSGDNSVCIWSRPIYSLQKILRGHTDCVTCLEYVDNMIFSCSKDMTMRIWECPTGTKVYKYTMVGATCITYFNRMLIMSYNDGAIRIWTENESK